MTRTTPARTPEAAAVREIRDRRGETVAQFAARLLVSPRTVEDWEQGRRTPSRLALATLARLRR